MGRLVPSPPPLPSATFQPAGESIRPPCNPRRRCQRKHGGALALALSASNATESVFRLWASVVEGTGRSRSVLTHINIGDDRSGIPRDVGGRFGRSEAQRGCYHREAHLRGFMMWDEPATTNHRPSMTRTTVNRPQDTKRQNVWRGGNAYSGLAKG